MHICWSFRNRLALIRIPLWWSFKKKTEEISNCRETFEYRGPDPLANPYLLFAGIAIATKYGLENPKEAIQIAEDLHVEEDVKGKKFKKLPRSCNESSKNLRKDRKFYEADNVFPKILINKTIERLKAYRDKDLWKNLADKPERIENLLKQYLYNG